MAEGDVTKSVMMKLKAADEGASASFKQLGNAAEGADKKVQGVGSQLKTAGKEMKGFERGVGALQGTVFGLTNSLGLMDERLGKMAGALGIVHTLTQATRGLGLTLGGGVGSALGVGVLGALGAVGVAAGAGYLLWNKYEEGIKESTERLKELQIQLRLTTEIGRLGLLPTELADRAASQYAISRPSAERQRSLYGQISGQNTAIAGMGLFPDNPFAPGLAGNRAEQIGIAGQAYREARVNVGAAPGTAQDAMARMQALAGLPLEGAPGLKRQMHGAQSEAELARIGENQARRALAGAQAGQAYREAHTIFQGMVLDRGRTAERLTELRQGGWNPAKEKERIKLEGLLPDQDAAIERGRRRMEAVHGLGIKPATGEDVQRRQQELQEAIDRRLQAEQKILQVRQQINTSNVADLQTIRASVAEQSKSFTEQRKSAEARHQGAQITLGNMGTLDKMGLTEIIQKVNSGQDLSQEELQFAGRFGFMDKIIQKQGLRRFGGEDRDTNEFIAKGAGLNDELAEARNAEGIGLMIKAQVENKIKAEIALGEGVENELREKLMPLLSKAIKDSLAQMVDALSLEIARVTRKKIDDAFNQQRADGAGGAPRKG